MQFMQFKTLRIKTGLSVAQLAREAEASDITLAKLERGEVIRAHIAQKALDVVNKYLLQQGKIEQPIELGEIDQYKPNSA